MSDNSENIGKKAKYSRKINPILKSYIPLIKGLGIILGSGCEVLLHDVSVPEHSIIACANAEVTGRSVGSPMTDFGLVMLSSDEYRDKTGVYNYISYAPDGHPLRCGVTFIRDEEDKIIGFLCINIDLTKINAAQKMLAEMAHIDTTSGLKPGGTESFFPGLDDAVETALHNVSRKLGSPLDKLSRKQRLGVISELESCGFFLMRSSVERLASAMGRSKFTIYAYLRKIHNEPEKQGNKKNIV